jgi:hypothetical protein
MEETRMSPAERLKLRTRAQRYALIFLGQKYRQEYRELYQAYLNNRGYKPYARYVAKPLVDERNTMETSLSKQ